MNNKEIISDQEMRIDKYLQQYFSNSSEPISRTKIQTLINNHQILVNNTIVTNNYQLKIADHIQILVPLGENQPPVIKPQQMELSIIYEDEDLMVIDKPNNLVVHPAPGHYEDTLVNGLLALDHKWSTIGGAERPGIVHRIDRQTTGLLVVAKNDFAHQHLQEQIQQKTMHRQYLAIVHGVIAVDKAKIIAPIGRDPNDRKKMSVTSKNSKNAITNIVVIQRFKDYTYIECNLETGRTHQIRMHLKYIKHPVLGDPLYGYPEDKNIPFGQYLHAYQLVLTQPHTGEQLTFTSQLPVEFCDKLAELAEKGTSYE